MKIRSKNKGSVTRAAKFGNLLILAVVVGLGFNVGTSDNAHAASLTDIITTPVTTLQTVLTPNQSAQPATTPQTQQTTPETTSPQQTQSTQTPSTTEPQTTQTQPSTSSQTRQTPTAVKEAGDQSVGDASPITYVSRQISQARADFLYMIAGGLALAGIIVYLLTLIPRYRSGRKMAAKKPAMALASIAKTHPMKVSPRLKTSER